MEIINYNTLFRFFSWYFFEVPKNILNGWINFLRFGFSYFSVPLLLRTLFYPWRRYRWAYPKGFDVWAYFEAFFSNLIFRTLGALFRSVFIVIGVVFEIFIFFVGLFIFLGWLVLPFFLVFGFYNGIRLLIYV